jgi:hypothetical protein
VLLRMVHADPNEERDTAVLSIAGRDSSVHGASTRLQWQLCCSGLHKNSCRVQRIMHPTNPAIVFTSAAAITGAAAAAAEAGTVWRWDRW